jgi:hypothetical protein
MTIATQSVKFSNNLRKMRRYLQGRGVNVRMTMIDTSADSPYTADSRLAVPGLHSDDVIIGLINWSDGVDITGYLDDGAKAASRTIQNLTITALDKGVEGNRIGVLATILDAQGAARISADLSVEFLGETITVRLATDGTGTANTVSSGPNSATNVRDAILDEQETLHGDAWVDVTGANASAWTAFSVLLLQNGANFDQGPKTASLTTDLDDTSPYVENSDIRYVAQGPGKTGNDISIVYTAGIALAVAVSDEQITVTYVADTTTAADVVAAVNASKAASALVQASLPSPSGIGDGLIATMGETFLAGGLDGGIQLTVSSAGVKILVLWVTRDERDETVIA